LETLESLQPRDKAVPIDCRQVHGASASLASLRSLGTTGKSGHAVRSRCDRTSGVWLASPL